MGFETRQAGNFFTILNGKFCQRVQAGTPGAKERVNKVGKTVHEIFHDSFTGKLIGITTKDGEYGKSWVFSFRDRGEIFNLQLGYSNSFAVGILKMLPNLDLSKEMKVSPSVKVEDGKNKSSIFINQDGSPIKHHYTRENPNGMPDLKQIKVKGVDVWDDTDRLAFLENMVMTEIVPKLEGVPATPETASAEPAKRDALAESFEDEAPAVEDEPF